MLRTILVLSVLAGLQAAEPLRLHPQNPHYFLFRGRATALVTSAEHYGAVLNGDFDYRRYLAALEADGLNYTRLFTGSYLELPAKSFGIQRNTLAPAPGRYVSPWARSESPGYAGGGNKLDLDKWNPQFFERLRDFLGEAARRGIIVELTLFSSQYNDTQWQLSPFNSANNVNGVGLADWKKINTLDNGPVLGVQERYVRKLVREANTFDNVFFEIQNEPWSDRTVLADVVNPYLRKPARDTYPNSIDLADDHSLAWQERVAGWIADEEASLPNKHLVAQNYCNFRFPVRAVVSGVNIVNFHYAYPEAATANYGLGLPLVYDETGFRGNDDAVYRREAWNFMLSGGGGFNNLDYSFSVGHEDGGDLEPNGPGGGSPALRKQLGVLGRFLHSFPLAELQPDTRTVIHSAGAYARVLSRPGRDYAIYLDGSGTATLLLDLPAGTYNAEWINTVNGATERSETIAHRGGARRLAGPSFRDGLALRIRAK